LIIGLLGDRETQAQAARALGRLLAGTGDEAALRALAAAAAEPDAPPHRLAAIGRALLEIGGDRVKAQAAALLARLELPAQASLRWRIEGITPESAVDRLRSLGIAGEVSLDRVRRDLGEETDGLFLLYAALEEAGVLTRFDTETGTIPVRHDELISEFAEGSRGGFRPEALLEESHQDDDGEVDGPYTVQFVFEERLFRFTAENFGDWYDVAAVVSAINAAHAETGRRGRFIGLDTGGQDAAFLFGDPEVIAAAARELHLPLLDDAGRPRAEGKAFEDAAIERLRQPAPPD
jgi:hypothetical protein